MSVIIGTGKPKIVIGATTINLPYCERLVEKFTEVYTEEYELYDTGELTSDLRGYRYAAELDYKKFTDVATLNSLEPLFTASVVNGDDIYLFPRADSSVNYKVKTDGGINLWQKTFHKGHGGLVLKFRGRALLTKIDLTS